MATQAECGAPEAHLLITGSQTVIDQVSEREELRLKYLYLFFKKSIQDTVSVGRMRDQKPEMLLWLPWCMTQWRLESRPQ